METFVQAELGHLLDITIDEIPFLEGNKGLLQSRRGVKIPSMHISKSEDVQNCDPEYDFHI